VAALETVTETPGRTGNEHVYLVAIDHGGPRVVTLARGSTVTVGRALECDVHVDNPSISRRHFSVRASLPLVLIDLGGVNGTRLNGHRVASGTSVAFGVGETIEAGGVFFMVHDRMPHQLLGEATRMHDMASAPGHREGGDVVVSDPAMHRLHELVSLVAASTIPVLVVGETGVGKELIALAVHARSPRAEGPYVCLNCAALPDTLLESELFGYEKGAFSGATQTKRGLIEGADRGTLFLDEVGEMALATQAKLLRVLENGELMRLGAAKPRAIDVRFVAATNRDLPALVAKGAFRRDLYFRLNGMTIPVPPLRERPAEIPTLARFFLARAAEQQGGPCPVVSDAVLERLHAHSWPGNVRELRHVMDRAFTLCRRGALRDEHIVIDRALDEGGGRESAPPDVAAWAPPRSPSASSPPAPMTSAREAVGRLARVDPEEEQRLIRTALEDAGWNQGKAAAILGISRRTLVNRLNEYQFKRPRK